MKILYRGTHQPMTDRGTPWTTETHWSASLELLGHEVIRNHEEADDWATTIRQAEDCDLFLWTSTWGFNQRWPRRDSFAAVAHLNVRMPTASLHLDRWWGLSNREHQIRESAMFQVGWVFTADGDHDERWQAEGVNHRWLPPGVFGPECVPGIPRDEWRADVAFIGNRDYGHREHAAHRAAMLDTLRARFGEHVAFWPRDGEPGPFGLDYNDLLASTKVVVGDSWQGANRYWSNRVFEVIGRGGFCVHPAVPGLVNMLPEGLGVAYFPPGDWDTMTTTIEQWIADEDRRTTAVAVGQDYVREHHSYTSRMSDMLDTMRTDGAWA